MCLLYGVVGCPLFGGGGGGGGVEAYGDTFQTFRIVFYITSVRR